jgi:hypothetical protein
MLLVMSTFCSTAIASSLETLIMPGKVVNAHAKYESKCEKCHEPFKKATQKRLCFKCHKKVARDIKERKGFHGHTRNIDRLACKTCHTEHIGRNADIIHLDTNTFDHHKTDFPLEGAHLGLACGSCHKQKAKYREAPSACNDCHHKDDPHKGRLGKDCGKCHGVKAWKTSRFDHDKTKFPLRGKHKEATCNSCHPNERYKNLAKECVACHRINDVHTERYGSKCEKCHNEQKWKQIIFDHDRDTKFKLRGAHAKIRCDTCHTGKLYGVKLGTRCYACHQHDDKHAGRYGRKCGACHGSRGWGHVTFSHDKDTKFPLRGAHKKVACEDCHRGDLDKEKDRHTCFACHKGDDVHKGKEGKSCDRCHNEQRWDKRVVFDHDMTRFPLIGLHAAVPCEECHLNTSYKVNAFDCDSCHKKDDVHKHTLGERCTTCHNPNGWRIWKFDHNTQTDYKLEGKHSKLNCKACHHEPVTGKIHLPTSCGSCHKSDDVHNGSFGPQCERCHTPDSFKDIRLLGRKIPRS